MKHIVADCIQPILLIIGCGTLTFSIAYLDKKCTNDAWRKFASNTGLEFKPAGLMDLPYARGLYKGLDYKLHIFMRRFGGNRSYTRIIIKFPSGKKNFSFHIYKEGILSKFDKVLGDKDIQIGDMQFDEAFMITGNTPDQIKEILTPSLREKLLRGRHFIDILADSESITYETSGILRDVSKLTCISEIMAELAINISNMG